MIPLNRSVKLKLAITPSKVPKSRLQFYSTKSDILKVDQKGKVTAKKSGQAYIIIRDRYQKKKKIKVLLFAGWRVSKLKFTRVPKDSSLVQQNAMSSEPKMEYLFSTTSSI